MDWQILLGIAVSAMFILLVYTIAKISTLSRASSDIISKINTMTAPAETLTSVTTALQTNIGGLQESISLMNQSITNISTQAMKIEPIGKKYEETESLTRRIHNIMIGSYEKGRSGENYLRNMMAELMKIGLVSQNMPIGSKVVEYCVVFSDGKLLAIDSKVVATKEVEALFDEETSDIDRVAYRNKIRSGLRRKVEEVCGYIDPRVTLPCAVMAIPDSIVPLSSEIIPEAISRNVMVVGYSAVPQLIVYFIRIHGFYSIQEDVAELKDRLMTIQKEVSNLDERFFANRIEKPITMLNNAVLKIRQVVGGINTILSLEYMGKPELPEETLEQ